MITCRTLISNPEGLSEEAHQVASRAYVSRTASVTRVDYVRIVLTAVLATFVATAPKTWASKNASSRSIMVIAVSCVPNKGVIAVAIRSVSLVDTTITNAFIQLSPGSKQTGTAISGWKTSMELSLSNI